MILKLGVGWYFYFGGILEDKELDEVFFFRLKEGLFLNIEIVEREVIVEDLVFVKEVVDKFIELI